MPLSIGDRIGDYEIEAELGEGGMARVYRARHPLLDTHHAIKVLDPEYRAKADARQRFLDEARIQAKLLDHPGIVKVSNIISTDEHAAIVMELVDGPVLEAEIATIGAQPGEVRRIMLAVLESVGHAHDAGIIHRDLKPANVLLAGPKRLPKITDFGIAKVTEDPSRGSKKKSTVATSRMGTLSYMSPEQIRRAKDATARSDIFSLGVMLYELATGALPFDADNDFDLMDDIVSGRYVPPADRNPSVDTTVTEVIRRALLPDPAGRYASCKEMADALRGSVELAAPAPPAPPAPPLPPVAPSEPESIRPRSRGPLIFGGGIVAIGGIALAVALATETTPSAGSDRTVAATTQREDAGVVDAPADASPDAPDSEEVALDRRCTAGEGPICRQLAVAYESGQGVEGVAEVDLAKAYELYSRGCDATDAASCLGLGFALEHARGVETNYKNAGAAYKRGCTAGSAVACTNLGWLMEKRLGSGGSAIVQAYKRGCALRSSTGCWNLSVLYMNGDKVTADMDAARLYMQKSCDAGDKKACGNVSKIPP